MPDPNRTENTLGPLDELNLIDILERLTPSDLSTVIIRIKGVDDIPNQEVKARAHHLIEYVKSSVGPGMEYLGEITAELFSQIRNKIYPNSRTSSTPLSPAQKPGTRFINLPQSNDYFTGRTEELSQLHSRLTTGNRAAVTQAISGLGGVGKISLAIAYAYPYEKDYDYVLFCRAEPILSRV